MPVKVRGGRTARRVPERAGADRDGRQGPSDRGACRRRPHADRGDELRSRRRHPAARGRPRGARAHRGPRRGAAERAGPQPPRVGESPARSASASTRSGCSCRPRRPTTGATSTARSSESMAELEQMIPAVGAAGLHCEAVIAVAFGCPYEGHVPAEHVLSLASRLVSLRRARDRLRRHHRDGQSAAGARVVQRGPGRARIRSS